MPLFWLGPLMIFRVIDSSYFDPADPLATKHAEVAYIALCRRLLPVGLTGMALAAMISATGSMVNSSLNVMSAVITRDFYARLIKPQASEKELLLVGRAMITVFGALIILVAWRIQSLGVVEYLFKILSILAGPLAVPFVCGIISRRISATAVWWSVLGGIAVSAAIEFLSPGYGWALSRGVKLLASTLVPLAILIMATAIARPAPDRQGVIDAFFRRMSEPLPAGARESAAHYGPIALIGVLTAVLGVAILQLVWVVREQRVLICLFGSAMIVFGVSLKIICRRRLQFTESERARPPGGSFSDEARDDHV